MKMKTLTPLCLLLITPALYAADQINKCVDAKGNTMYTDEPCTTLKPNPSPPQPAPPGAAQKPKTAPVPPIQPPPEQLIPQPPAPAPAAKPQQ